MAGSRLETIGSVFTRCVSEQGSRRVTTLLAWLERDAVAGVRAVRSLRAPSWLGMFVAVPSDSLSVALKIVFATPLAWRPRIKKTLKGLTRTVLAFPPWNGGWAGGWDTSKKTEWLQVECGGPCPFSEHLGGEA